MRCEFAPIAASSVAPATRHWIGGELAPRPIVVVCEVGSDGVLLIRYGADSTFAGDTWHANIEDARHQAEFEFGATLGLWAPIPAGTDDTAGYAVASASAPKSGDIGAR